MVTRSVLIGMTLVLGLAVGTAFAQGQRPGAARGAEARQQMRAKWEGLTPEQRQALKGKAGEARARWQEMTPEQRKALKANAREARTRWQELTPEQREAAIARAKEARARWQEMTPKGREALKEKMLERRGAGGGHRGERNPR